jgi:ribose 5-phosphate isomerase
MFILQMEHAVPDFNGWKKAFDSDPLNRKQSGVRSYRIFKVIDNLNYVIIELEFDNLKEAQTMHQNLKQLWGRVEGRIMNNPQARIVEVFESKQL